MTYIDLTKEFNTVSRDSLWKIMAKYGCREKLITIVWQFYDGMHARTQDNGESSVAFPVTNRVKQEWVFDPSLFGIMFSAMLFDAFCDIGIEIRYHYWYLYLQRQKASNKDEGDMVNEFLFADYWALNATSIAKMQNKVDKFAMASDNIGQAISTKKDWSDAPASAWKTIHRVQHQHQETTTEGGRKVHQPRLGTGQRQVA